MDNPDLITTYLAELRRALPFGGSAAERIISEIRDHLSDSRAALEASGLARAEAAARAVERFGSARAVAERFAAELRAPRFAVLLCAIVGSIMAAVGMGLYFVYPDPGTGVSVPLALAAVAVAVTAPRHVRDHAGWFERSSGRWGFRAVKPAGNALLAGAAIVWALLTAHLVHAATQAPHVDLDSLAAGLVFTLLLVGAPLVHAVHATAGHSR